MVTHQYKKWVTIHCHLSIGDEVIIEGWGYKFDNKHFSITDIKYALGCESGFLVKIDGYENYIDSGWITLVPSNS